MPRLSVVITTRNRKDEVLVCVESCLAQSVRPLEVLVYDDASEDGTYEALKVAFPEVWVERDPQHLERLVLRNRGVKAAGAEYIAFLDDDCYLIDPGTFERALALLEADASVAVVGLAMIEPYRERRPEWQPMRMDRGEEIGSFLGGACLMRRQAYLAAGGYRELLVHHVEEKDLGLRLLESGWRFVYAAGQPLVHTYSQRRSGYETGDGVRNTLLVNFLNLPVVYVIPAMFSAAFRMLAHKFRWKDLGFKMAGIRAGVMACWRFRSHRHAVSMETFRRFRRLPWHEAEAPVAGQSVAPLRRE